MARLLYHDRDGRPRVIELGEHRPQAVIGRQDDCDIVVPDTSVSRRHCTIALEDAGFVVIDLGSANGTLVNDVRVTRRSLASNDVIRCGIFAVRFADEAESAETVQGNLRDRYRRRAASGDSNLRASIERLTAVTENQTRRLAQLQEELSRADAERASVAEHLGRRDAELGAARAQLVEMQGHLRHLAAALQHREAELASLAGAEPSGANGSSDVASSGRSIGRVAAVAEHEVMRAEIQALQGELAAERAFVRSARVVPAHDRWADVAESRAKLGSARRRIAKATAAAERAREAAEDRARRADVARAEADSRMRAAEKALALLKAATATPKADAGRGLPAQRGSVLGGALTKGAGPKRLATGEGRLLSGLGGLGRTAPHKAAERAPLAKRLAALNRQSETTSRIHESEEMVRRLQSRMSTAREAALLLSERLRVIPDEADLTGLAAVQVAELLDLADAIDGALSGD